MKFVVIIILVGLLINVFFDRDFPESSFPEIFNVSYLDMELYRQQEIGETKRGEYLFDELEKIITDNSLGWKVSIVNYVPNVVFSSKVMKIDVHKTFIVVNSSLGKNWMQIYKKIHQNEVMSLMKKVKSIKSIETKLFPWEKE